MRVLAAARVAARVGEDVCEGEEADAGRGTERKFGRRDRERAEDHWRLLNDVLVGALRAVV